MLKTSKKILIVEDEELITKILAHKLVAAGYITAIARDGQEALSLLKTEKFDLIILDLVMPHKDGFAVLEELRKRHDLIPVIVTSNLSQDEDINRAMTLGVKKYFVKVDSTVQEIVDSIKTFL